MCKKKVYCILDIGGTKILSVLIDSDKNVIYKETFPSVKEGNVNALIKQINATVDRAFKQVGEKAEIAGIGICIAAFVDFEKGVLNRAPNLPVKDKLPLRDILYEHWQLPVIIENDTNAAVLGEVNYGAARGYSDVIYVTVSTGIGGGLYLGGRLYRGRDGFAGEIGHLKHFGNNLCGCGKEGCLESAASGGAIARMGQSRIEPGITTAGVFEEARKGSGAAAEIIDNSMKALGITFANIITLLNPECIVVGGGVTKAGKQLFSDIEEYIKKYLSIEGISNVRLEKAKLEPESGIWGILSLF